MTNSWVFHLVAATKLVSYLCLFQVRYRFFLTKMGLVDTENNAIIMITFSMSQKPLERRVKLFYYLLNRMRHFVELDFHIVSKNFKVNNLYPGVDKLLLMSVSFKC